MTEYDFVKNLIKTLPNTRYVVKQEIDSGYGVADIVMISVNKPKLRKRLAYRQSFPLHNENYFKVLNVIPDRNTGNTVQFKKIFETTKLSQSYLMYKILKDLMKHGYVKTVNKNYYFKINGWAPIANEVIAIEAKLKDWKRGIIQANRYKSFADKVYLAIPSKIAHLPPICELEKFNIGLISYNIETNTKKYIYKPKIQKASNQCKRNFVTELFWSKNIAQNFAI